MLLLSSSSTQMTHVAVVANPFERSAKLVQLGQRFYKRAEDVGFAKSKEKIPPGNPVGRPRKDRRQENEKDAAQSKTDKVEALEALQIVGMAMAGDKRAKPEFELTIEAVREDNCKRARLHADEPFADEPFAEEHMAAEQVATEPVAEEPVPDKPVLVKPISEGLFLVEPVFEKGHVVFHYTPVPDDFFSDIPSKTLDAPSPYKDVATSEGEVQRTENPLAGILDAPSDDE